MKKTNLFFGIVLSVLLAFSFTACEPDPVVDNDPPTLTLISGDTYISGNAQVDPGVNIKVKLKGVVGTGDLNTLYYYENGLKLDLETRLGAGVNGNPDLLRNGDESGFEKEITFVSQADGTSDYKFVLVDVNGLKDSVEFTLTLNPQETPLNFVSEDITVGNFKGPAKGSIDLQKGEAVSSGDDNGDVQDIGWTEGTNDWAKKIKPKNGTEMVLPLGDVTFDGVTSIEQLKAAYLAGTVAEVSDDVIVGSLFLFKSPSVIAGKFDYFILTAKEVVESVGDNNDYYVFGLKGHLAE